MASLSLSNASSSNGGSCTITMSGFSSPFNWDYYDKAGVSTTSFTSGQTTQPANTVSWVYAPTSNSSTSYSWTADNLGYGLKTLYGWARPNGGNYWSSGSASITIPSPPVIPNPPYNISHSVNGQNCIITFSKGANADYTGIYYYAVDPASGYSSTTSGTSFYLTGLGNEVTWHYSLISYTNAGQSSSYTQEYTFTTGIGRPSNYYFTGSFTSGGDAQIYYDVDWLYFKSVINEFRRYKSLSEYTFAYSPYRGDDLAAVDFNDVRTALWGLSGYMTGSYSGGILVPASQVAGNDIYASFFNNMRDSLNSIS